MTDDFDLRVIDQRHEPDPQFRAALQRRVAAIVATNGSTSPSDPLDFDAETLELKLAPRPARPRARRTVALGILAAASAAAAVLVVAVVKPNDHPSTIDSPAIDSVETNPSVVTTIPSEVSTTADGIDVAIGVSFASAIEASGAMTMPSADEVAQASDASIFQPDSGPTQISAADNFVSLRTCNRTRGPSSPCASGWAYVTGTVDDTDVHRGLLGEAGALEAYVLDDRYFVALGSPPTSQPGSIGWLIDSVSGASAELTWSSSPVRVTSAAQAVLVFDDPSPLNFAAVKRFLPRVVDASDATIHPLAVPDDALADLPVSQHGTGRIWVGTTPDGPDLGVAYSDDGGATWTDVTLPSALRPTNSQLASLGDSNDKLLSIAADGDRIAAMFAWPPNADRNIYVSSDAGQTWSTVPTVPDGNGAHLSVLADGRLMLVWSMDPYPTQVRASTGPDWLELEDLGASQVTGHKYFSTNRVGVFFSYALVGENGYTIDFSSDLKNWRRITSLSLED